MGDTKEDAVGYFSQVQQSEGWTAILESFARFVNPPSGARLVDVGCGPGALVEIFRRDYSAQAFGADRLPDMFATRTMPIYCAAGLPDLPFPTASLDLVTATNVIYLLDSPLPALQEIARVLRPGGTFAMLNPSEQMTRAAATALAAERGLTGFQRDNFVYWGEVAEANHRWTENDINTLFQQAGLRPMEMRLRVGAGLARYAKGDKP